MLLAASASGRIHRMLVSAPYTRDVVARYVAGDDALAAVETTRRLQAAGLLVSLDYLGEDTTDSDQAAAVATEYVGLLARLGAHRQDLRRCPGRGHDGHHRHGGSHPCRRDPAPGPRPAG
jgi:proline dehydrogenase